MKKLILAILALFAVVSIHAQIITGTVSTWNCGRLSTPTYCYRIPITVTVGGTLESGTLWLDQQSSGSGFVQFLNGFLDLGKAHITSPFAEMSMAGGTLAYSFTGTDATGKNYEGSLALTYTTYYSRGGGGKGGGGAGWRWVVTGGKVVVGYPVPPPPGMSLMERKLASPQPLPGISEQTSSYNWCGNIYPLGSCPLYMGGPWTGIQWWAWCHTAFGNNYLVSWCNWTASNCPCP